MVCIQQDSKLHATLKPVILEEIMEMHRQQIRDLIACEKCYPVDHAKFYNKYAKLISKEVCVLNWRSDTFGAHIVLSALLPAIQLTTF